MKILGNIGVIMLLIGMGLLLMAICGAKISSSTYCPLLAIGMTLNILFGNSFVEDNNEDNTDNDVKGE